MTRSNFIIRVILTVVGGLVLGWPVVAITADRVLARRAPAIALNWNPGSADANAQLATDMLQNDPSSPAVLVGIRARALRSLDRQPLNPSGARLLGFGMVASDPAKAQRLLLYAESMSRRDLPTQIWLIESAVQRGDVDAALIHYDRALRTTGSSRAVLFPVLASAANEPSVWRPLSVLLARRPQWWRPFLEQTVPASTSPAALYVIARRMGLERGSTADGAMLQTIEKRLVDLSAYAQAADLYDRAHGVAPGRGPLLHNGGFEQPGGWDPFDWNLNESPDLAALRQPSPVTPSGTALFLSAGNGRGGDVALQFIMLRPGTYQISAVIGAVHGDKLAYPQLLVRCAEEAREILHVPFPPAPDGGRNWRMTLTVPANCPAQRLVIQALSTLEPANPMPWIDDIVIRPVKGQ